MKSDKYKMLLQVCFILTVFAFLCAIAGLWWWARQPPWADGVTIHTGGNNGVWFLAFTPDGDRILTGTWEDGIRVWDSATGVQVSHPLANQRTDFDSIGCSRDGSLLVLARDVEGEVRGWDLTTRDQVFLIRHNGGIHSIAFSPDGKTLATGGWGDRSVRLWSIPDGRELFTLSGNSSAVVSLAFSSDGELLASGDRSGNIIVWKLSNNKDQIHIQHGGRYTLSSIAFSPDGKSLATCGGYTASVFVSGSGSATVWDTDTGRGITSLQTPIELGTRVSFSPDGRFLAVGTFDGRVLSWDQTTGKEREVFRRGSAQVLSMSFSPDGSKVGLGLSTGEVFILRVQDWPGE